MRTNLASKKCLVVGIILVFMALALAPSINADVQTRSLYCTEDLGTLSGYVTDTEMNPIEGAMVRVYFHEEYRENDSDAAGYYHVTDIPICYCMKNATCIKDGYYPEWALLSIAENTTYDFILTPLNQSEFYPPSGPTQGYVGVEYTFSFTIPVNPNGDECYTKWDWGDSNISDWLGPYPSGQITSASHIWMHEGTYYIRVKLKDTNGTESPWSDPHVITIIEYRPPNPPNITGPHYGKIKTNYTFSIGSDTNPDGDQFYTIWDWGDGNQSGWLGPFYSGVNVSHAWSEPGNYSIKVRIKDVWGASSNWSAPFFITIVKLKPAFFFGSFKSSTQTTDLIVMDGRIFVVFPSLLLFHIEKTIVLSKRFLGGLGTSFILGVGGIAILQQS